MIKNQNLNIPYSPYTDTLEEHMRLVVEHIRQMAPGKKLQIAIYGMGSNGIYLCHSLSGLDCVEAIFCVDRSVKININGCMAMHPDELAAHGTADAVLVATSPQHYKDIERFLAKTMPTTPVVFMFDHFVEKTAPTCASKNNTMDSRTAAIRAALNTGQFFSANLLIRSGLQYNPDHPGLLRLKSDLAERVEAGDLDDDELIGQVRSPNTIVLQLIDHCNLKCYMCFRQNGTYTPHPFFKKPMSRGMFEHLVEGIDFRRVASVCLGGSGEVFLHPDILYFTDYIIERGGRVQFITNGSLLHKRLAEQLAERSGYDFQLSLDAFTFRTYESIRVGARFDDVIEKFRYYCDCLKASGTDVNLSIASVLMRRSIEEFPMIVSFASELGIPVVTGNHIVMTGHAVHDPDESLVFHPELFNRVRCESLELAANKGVTVHLPEPFPLGQAQTDREKESSDAKANYWDICHEPWTRLDMRTGAFCICCGGYPGLPFKKDFLMAPESEPFSLAFMTGYASINDVFNAKPLQTLRKQLLTNKPSRYCRNCFQQSNNLHKFNFYSAFNKDIMPSDAYAMAKDAFMRKFHGTPYLQMMIREGR